MTWRLHVILKKQACQGSNPANPIQPYVHYIEYAMRLMFILVNYSKSDFIFSLIEMIRKGEFLSYTWFFKLSVYVDLNLGIHRLIFFL